MEQNLNEFNDNGKNTITRRQAVKLGGAAAVGLIFSRPIIDTIRPRPLFASYGPGPGPGPDPDPSPTGCCIGKTKPKSLTFQYTGGNCDVSDNQQAANKFSCGGDPTFNNESMTVEYIGPDVDKVSPFSSSGTQIFTGDPVELGQEITIEATGKADLGNRIELKLTYSSGETQTLKIHTSCSADLNINDVFGSLTLVDCDPQGVVGGLCDGGKPKSLGFIYTGLSCDASDNGQGKAECTDFVTVDVNGFAMVDVDAPVIIIPVGKSSNKMEVIPSDESIHVGEGFTIVAKSRRGRKKRRLPSNTELEIRQEQGGVLVLLQTLKIHTSCSQPLVLGDIFGGLELVTFDDHLALIPSLCDDLGRPKELTFIYTGEDCGEKDNDQGKKAKCSGLLGGFGSSLTAVYTGKDPDKVAVTVVGDKVTIKANGGKNRLPSNTKLEITNGIGGKQNLEIHTSCSRPLDIGDQFGSLELVGFVSKSGATAP